MNSRRWIAGGLGLLSVFALWAAMDQRHELTSLRAEQQRLLAENDTATAGSAAGLQVGSSGPARDSVEPEAVSPELLRLRSEVAALTRQLRELDGIQQENDRLRGQLPASQTNSIAHKFLPPGFMRRSQAQFVGYNSPEDTLQTLLWALQNSNVTNLLQVFSPTIAERFSNDVARSGPDNFFRDAKALVGLGITERKQLPDGAIELMVEPPGLPAENIRFEFLNGGWKIASQF
jgi:hypothetical protein